MSRTTTRFLSGVKQRITMVANQALLTDDQILELASDVLETDITKVLVASKQNYLVGPPQDVPLVADEEAYDLPYRSVAGGLHEIMYYNPDNEALTNLALVDIEDLAYRTSASNTGSPRGFYFRGDQVVIVPRASSNPTGYLRLWTYNMPSKLCLVGDAGQVTDISGTTVTISTLPSAFIPGYVVDFVKNKSISTTLDMDAAITNVSGTQLTFVAVPPRLVVGDWVTPAGFTPILPIPDQLNRYFEGLTGAAVLYAISDYEGSRALMEEVRKDEKDVQSLIEPRIDGEIEKIVNYGGLLRGRGNRRFGTFGW